MPLMLLGLAGSGLASWAGSYFGEKGANDKSNLKNMLLIAAAVLALIAIAFTFFWKR